MSETDSMNDRPHLLGYMRKHLLMTDDELRDTAELLAYFAYTNGFDLKAVYVEQPATAPAAFGALVEAVRRDAVTTVVMPSLLHLAALGIPLDIKSTFERATGARVIIGRPSPAFSMTSPGDPQ